MGHRSNKPETSDDVAALFTYHPPKDGQTARYECIRADARVLAQTILNVCPPCADRSAAIRKIREAVMTANAAIALEE